MKTFTLRPYIGADPVTFEMTVKDVAKVLGPAKQVRTTDLDERDEVRGKVSVRYSSSDGKAIELAFLPGATLLFQSHDLFTEEHIVDFLIQHDTQPFECLGFLIFLKLGITLTGFHDQAESQRAITVFRRGRWDELREEMTPFHPTKKR